MTSDALATAAHSLPARPLPLQRGGPSQRLRSPLATKVWLAFGAVMLLVTALTGAAAMQLPAALAFGVLVLGIASLLVAAATALWLLRNIAAPLASATHAASLIKAGDLSNPVDLRRAGALEPLLRSVQELHERLFAIVTHVRLGTSNVAVNAAQIAKENDALQERTIAQSASVQHTATSTEELTATVRQGASTAREAHALVRSASERAEHGGRVMGEVVQTMEAIDAGSQGIRDIIGVIDAIAFQTNLLALNAAVEAARAGEQGRGFAVVAGEVRTLAKRCAEAAREIRELIVGSVRNVEQGAHRVQQARDAMATLVAAIRQVSELIGHIDGSTQEQSSGIATINGAVASIERATHGNDKLVRDAARTSSELRQRAADLFDVVAMFQLGDREHGSARDAVDLVQRGCDFLQAHGRQALLNEVNRLDFGQFVYRDLYLIVLDDSATFIAHGNNPSRLGTGPEVRDIDGKAFPREMVRVAREQGEGWVDYKWVHPVTAAVSMKSGYVRRAGDLSLYASVYKV